MFIAALQKINNRTVIKACNDELVRLAECAKSIQFLTIDVPVKLRIDELRKSLMSIATLPADELDDYRTKLEDELNESEKCMISTESLINDIVVKSAASADTVVRLKTEYDRLSKLREAIRNIDGAPLYHYLTYFPEDSMIVRRIDSMSDADLLSLAVSGGKHVSGSANCLSVDEVQAIAKVIQPLTSSELATRHDPFEMTGGEGFDEFKKFYLRAAKYQDAVLVRWI